MATKQYTVNIPEYLTLSQYESILAFDGMTNVERILNTIGTLTGIDIDVLKSYPLDLLVEINNDLSKVMDPKNEFHSIIEWDGELYGFANMKQVTLGEYMDLENLIKDMDKNMHKIAAILYRPIVKHRFTSLKFAVKQKIKMVSNSVENVFDWYDIEKYNSDKRKDREELFKEFPVHIFLGALSFFLTTASLYFNRIQYLSKIISKRTMMTQEKQLMESLTQTTGAGGGLFTTSLSPIYYRLQETKQSPT
jgi:hypothetical protein